MWPWDWGHQVAPPSGCYGQQVLSPDTVGPWYWLECVLLQCVPIQYTTAWCSFIKILLSYANTLIYSHWLLIFQGLQLCLELLSDLPPTPNLLPSPSLYVVLFTRSIPSLCRLLVHEQVFNYSIMNSYKESYNFQIFIFACFAHKFHQISKYLNKIKPLYPLQHIEAFFSPPPPNPNKKKFLFSSSQCIEVNAFFFEINVLLLHLISLCFIEA